MFECTPLCQIWPPVLLYYYSVQISHELSPQHLPSPPNIPLLPLNVSIYVRGRGVWGGGVWGATNWLLTNPTSYWFPIATVCLAASYYANIANISEHTRPICPLLLEFWENWVKFKGFWSGAQDIRSFEPPFLASLLFVPCSEAAVIY